ncbi:twin-arginine translocase TatA/TatE family subunit [Paracoccus caeni]|uniref:Sec-independent protein translocase protein TatA n=1 Tax=Paracoccus caeni TaxID=657651 RepID=A0A934SED9_9RHOB|nr:twin-arginine translocase TatA/TatE family subunit [Paracoccus caeni]MBK4217356.1 twin-arginine translocase TatA/TatE family subunit [Paracoccus caeni]
MFQNIGLPGLLLIAVVVLVLFGRGKVSSLMGEVGKGITAFKKGVNDGNKEIENATDTTQDATRDVKRDVPGEAARDVTPPTTDRS